MRFADTFLDEIRARLPVSAVVGRKVRLKKQGREFAGLSPFNAEKTPSFFVNDQKAKWFDFSAGKTGDIFTFVMETEGLSFPEAVERLAGEAGLPIPARDPEAEAREKERASLYEVVAHATEYFEEQLNGRAGAGARGYLTSRDIGPDLQRRFHLGYAPPERAGLKQYLAGKGVDQTQMADAGLIVTGPDIAVSFDRFRDRVIFPITDMRGRTVGFGGRALSDDVPAKYLNSPETELFRKGSLLYNGAVAREAARTAGAVIAVEGYIDVIRMVAAGFAHTVAPLGTALTEPQLRALWRMADEPVLCFDGDQAGRRAAYRIADMALPLIGPGRSLGFALLPEGTDPDDLIRGEGGQAMAAVLKAARPLHEMIWARETEAGVFDTPERRAALEARLGAIARTISDDGVRRHYQQAFGERVEAFFPASTEQRIGGRGRRRGSTRPSREGGGRRIAVSDRLKRSTLLAGRAAAPLREVVLVMIMVRHPGLIAAHLDDFAHLELSSRDLDSLRAAVLEIMGEGGDTDAAVLAEALAGRGLGPLIGRLEGQIAATGHWEAAPEAADSDAETGWLQALALYRRKRTLHSELKAAEAALASDPSDANMARLVEIQKQLANSEGTEALIEGFGAPSGRPVRAF